MLNYYGTVIRPPSEADSLILQVTLGCSDNSCIFCPAYKDKKFKIKNIREIEKDIATAAAYYPETRRVFLADGDALIIAQKDLLRRLRRQEKPCAFRDNTRRRSLCLFLFLLCF